MISNNRGFVMMTFIIILVAFSVGFGAFLLSKQNDSPVEQAAEAVLKTQGIDVDFSPDDDDD